MLGPISKASDNEFLVLKSVKRDGVSSKKDDKSIVAGESLKRKNNTDRFHFEFGSLQELTPIIACFIEEINDIVCFSRVEDRVFMLSDVAAKMLEKGVNKRIVLAVFERALEETGRIENKDIARKSILLVLKKMFSADLFESAMYFLKDKGLFALLDSNLLDSFMDFLSNKEIDDESKFDALAGFAKEAATCSSLGNINEGFKEKILVYMLSFGESMVNKGIDMTDFVNNGLNLARDLKKSASRILRFCDFAKFMDSIRARQEDIVVVLDEALNLAMKDKEINRGAAVNLLTLTVSDMKLNIENTKNLFDKNWKFAENIPNLDDRFACMVLIAKNMVVYGFDISEKYRKLELTGKKILSCLIFDDRDDLKKEIAGILQSVSSLGLFPSLLDYAIDLAKRNRLNPDYSPQLLGGILSLDNDNRG
ncbi:hypothetical protein A2230_05370 [candidate division WOR-1 bacterium RIFOXYA2_FULL_36_21]|uniref:Uncharacterized protein n=1 Tax=candidate division WOR-1 bacterium RIFOXYB2_FULL_36_35 TaxID=1802578 RepID=A0A1F4S4Z4_UNCSA|nr:MAG: hypothetical protein A2230_05370 [candidate division WOR-1 bacterium RIFOXYA2_FULL_36_21]OGC14511.1 MAG: hypothetical protein A2282_09430 [candidate division WOR-1 bacterium RIFOXYA12_FULL_36_13]OGC15490.1 MAG: hypothetical protein A2290_03765 [candidate division WOR-1 bacterium RIFOXYB2_FULL_36_35]